MRKAMLIAGCGLLGVSFSACESTEQESAKIAREGQRLAASQTAFTLGRANRQARVSDVTLLSEAGRAAVAARITATSTLAQTSVPVLVRVAAANGAVLYSNDTAGLEPSLQHDPLLPAGRPQWWVDDQVLTSKTPVSASVRLGTGSTVRGLQRVPVPVGLRVRDQGGVSVLSGTLSGHDSRPLGKDAVFAVALRGGRVVAAGRALIDAAPAGSAAGVPFQIFLVGSAAGASIQTSVAPVSG